MAVPTAGRRVLVIDDEAKIRTLVRGYLEADGFTVSEAADGPGGLRAALDDRPDLLVLDVMLPGLDGFEVLRRLRETSDVPVVLLTARDEEIDRVVGFNAGGDDFVTKPFSARELALRVRAILRRAATREPDDGVLRFDGLLIDPDRRTVVVDGDRHVDLTALDFDILRALARAPGHVHTRRQLLERVWGHDFFGDERVVDVHIRTIRRGLGDEVGRPRFVGTVRNVGYRLVATPSDHG